MADKKTDEVRIAMADYVLTNIRRTIIVSNAVERQLNSSRPRPTSSSKPMTGFTKSWDGSPKPRSGSTKPSPGPKTAPVKRSTDIIEDESI